MKARRDFIARLRVSVICWCGGGLLSFAAPAAPVKILFDTDMETDCYDAGALSVLHSLADRGECEILATVVSVKDPNSAATVDAINICRGRHGLPIGMVKGSGVLEKSSYVSLIASEFPHRFKAGGEGPDAPRISREFVEKQHVHSVVTNPPPWITYSSSAACPGVGIADPLFQFAFASSSTAPPAAHPPAPFTAYHACPIVTVCPDAVSRCTYN